MILFKDLKQGCTVHFFDRKTANYEQGIIASDPSLPHYQNTQPTMVVDVAITVGSDTKTYSIPESLGITYCGDICISTDVPSILNEVSQLANQADTAIASLPKWQDIKKKCSDLSETLNPSVKEKKILDERMFKLESSISSMQDAFNKFIEKFN